MSFFKTNNNDAYFIGIDHPIQINITVTFSRLYFRKLFKNIVFFLVSAPTWIIGDGTVMHLATSEGKVSYYIQELIFTKLQSKTYIKGNYKSCLIYPMILTRLNIYLQLWQNVEDLPVLKRNCSRKLQETTKPVWGTWLIALQVQRKHERFFSRYFIKPTTDVRC